MKSLRLWPAVIRGLLCVAAVVCGSMPAGADTRSWVGTTGLWHQVSNWDGGVSLPGRDDSVQITNSGACVTLASSAGVLALTLSRTLIFTNWNTCLSVTNDVTIASGGRMTCAGPFTNAPAMSNRVYVVCSNFFVVAGGSVNVDAKGYAGGIYGGRDGQGPGGGSGGYYPNEAGTYGGFGVKGHTWTTTHRAPYGTPAAPLWPGSGGGAAVGYPGGAGGGAVRIVASGCVTVNGTISANGEWASAAAHGGSWYVGAPSGSGGGIYITCDRFAGANGMVRANGGDQASSAVGYQSGGGGRIAVHYRSASQSSAPLPSVQFTALPGADWWPAPAAHGGYYGDIGSLWFPDARFWSTNMALLQGQLFGVSSWSAPTLVLTNRWVGFSEEGFTLTVTGNVRVAGVLSGLSLGGPLSTNCGSFCFTAQYRYGAGSPARMDVAGNLLIANKARLYVYSAPTNAPQPDYGALVRVAGELRITSNSWVFVTSHPANGGSPYLWVKNLTLDQGGTISADYRGYAGGQKYYEPGRGPGAGKCVAYWAPGGAGYGGVGGGGAGVGGDAYGSSNAPAAPGSGGAGGGSGRGKPGGGLIRVQADNRLDLNGNMTANGLVDANENGGSGSGGGIYLRCKTFCAGTKGGPLTAIGGVGGNGGGGRIAVWRVRDTSVGVISTSVTNGTLGGAVGSVHWGVIPPSGTVISIR